jgi:protein-L-isoaspartate(D-aspartate) O-methyltransferase
MFEAVFAPSQLLKKTPSGRRARWQVDSGLSRIQGRQGAMRRLSIVLALLFPVALAFAAQREDFAQARRLMVENQLRARGISSKAVLAAMLKVPRQEFVPADQRGHAYYDGSLPIGLGQTISQPYVVALMTQELRLRKGDKVLEIGTGSGYQAAVLAEITPNVYSIEIIPELARRARKTLDGLGYRNVKTRVGDGFLGWKENAPFDAIIVTCAADPVPQPLVDQLKDGGRMVIPVGEAGQVQKLAILRKKGNSVTRTDIADVLFVPMTRAK